MSRSKVLSSKRKRKKKPDLLTDVKQLVSMGLNMVLTVYMFLVIAVMPFYFTDGYARIGTDKHEFLYNITGYVGVIFLPILLIYLVVQACVLTKKKEQKELCVRELLKGMTVTDWFALAYGVIVLLSYVLSDYKAMGDYGSALKGTNRWYMGLVTQLIFVAVYFAVSRFWKKNKLLPALWFPVTLVLYVLGYLNRFGVRPIKMKNATSEFISTIGNMNWYCGYIVIIFFGMLYYIWSHAEKKAWTNIFFGVWVTIGFGTLITQASRSGVVTLAVTFIVLYMLSVKSEEKLQLFFAFLASMSFACVVTYCLRSYFPDKFNYSDSVTDLLTNSPVALILLGCVSLICLILGVLQIKGKNPTRVFTALGYMGCGLIVIAFVVFMVLGIKNTLQPGSIGVLSEMSAFTFNLKWGSNRGATWAAGWLCFCGQDLLGKLFGVGPDCMAMYVHSGVDTDLLAMVKECFSGLLLTNAHNEWLTILVNTGLLGAISYVGLMVSAMVRYLKAGGINPLAGACGFAVLAYTVNNMFSFQQSMSAITIFLVLGMGEAYMRKKA